MDAGLGVKLIELLARLRQSLRKLRVEAHRGVLLNTGEACLFINVTNLSPSRDIEVTHVWLETDPKIHVARAERPLPKRLKPDESWETFVTLDQVPERARESVVHLGRVQLSTRKTYRSVHRKNLPGAGFVPGP